MRPGPATAPWPTQTKTRIMATVSNIHAKTAEAVSRKRGTREIRITVVGKMEEALK